MTLVIDSSIWIEYFSGGPKAGKCGKFILSSEEKLVPSLVFFEVYKKIKKTLSEEDAVLAVTQMQSSEEISLDANLALSAADVSIRHDLAMADSIVYATSLTRKARLVTADQDFKGLPGVIVL